MEQSKQLSKEGILAKFSPGFQKRIDSEKPIYDYPIRADEAMLAMEFYKSQSKDAVQEGGKDEVMRNELLAIMKENLSATVAAKGKGWKDILSSSDSFDCIIETYSDLISIIEHLPLKRKELSKEFLDKMNNQPIASPAMPDNDLALEAMDFYWRALIRKRDGPDMLGTIERKNIDSLIEKLHKQITSPQPTPAITVEENQDELWVDVKSIMIRNSYYQYYGEDERTLQIKTKAYEELKSKYIIHKLNK